MSKELRSAELWLPVVGFYGLYEVSSIGNVRRVGKAARTGKGRGGGVRLGHLRRLQITPYGYMQVQLWKGGKNHPRQVHVLVAEAFIGSKPDGHEVNHIDGNKQNNTDVNLEWSTRSENMFHAYRIGIRSASVPSGETHHNASLTDVQVVEIRRIFRRGSGPLLARRFGVDHSTIYRIVKQQTRVAPCL